MCSSDLALTLGSDRGDYVRQLTAAQEQEGYHFRNFCSTGSRNDIYGHYTVFTSSSDAARETYNLEDQTVQGLLHFHDS